MGEFGIFGCHGKGKRRLWETISWMIQPYTLEEVSDKNGVNAKVGEREYTVFSRPPKAVTCCTLSTTPSIKGLPVRTRRAARS